MFDGSAASHLAAAQGSVDPWMGIPVSWFVRSGRLAVAAPAAAAAGDREREWSLLRRSVVILFAASTVVSSSILGRTAFEKLTNHK
ncbi:hypothetical protein [Bradyrhizobium sp. BWA-3-5]|uniref:hypothetical protein n=1 Tax=Bradyrhizobium sp. BWA-3-5 TaxID=3080013 RepID=UPI00293E9967|nr:hypothetical protein [Bradyrhizobium sp. BWA-3-5]WOH64074.1 hypothetical protein RX331_26145 [Bradyrhizobium sp. BWA-3-5]WOH64200.1 hypothetical protein RX331_26935 [Bradyrhizobium sp. BWA-3-5]WOH70123.1 hypothetical protein RX331_38080 [Bradyrhizobium sp. BWA-3-5]